MTKKDKNTRFGENSMRIERDQEEQAIGKPQGTSSHIRRSFSHKDKDEDKYKDKDMEIQAIGNPQGTSSHFKRSVFHFWPF